MKTEVSWIRRNRVLLYGTLALLMLAVVLGLYWWQGINNARQYGSIDVAAMHGDSFGRVNALFSGLAFAGVVLALLIQTAELHITEKERIEALEAQKSISKQQYFASLSSAITTLNELETDFRKPRGPINTVDASLEIARYLQRGVLRATVGAMVKDSEADNYYSEGVRKQIMRVMESTQRAEGLIQLHYWFTSRLATVKYAREGNNNPKSPLAECENIKAHLEAEFNTFNPLEKAMDLHFAYDFILKHVSQSVRDGNEYTYLDEHYDEHFLRLKLMTTAAVAEILRVPYDE